MNPPTLGGRARCASRLVVRGRKRRLALILLGAIADANGGVCRPDIDDLIARVPNLYMRRDARALLRRLEADGYIRRRPEGEIELLFAAHEADIAGTEQVVA
ncbi:MAG TPA: hypothetical protein VK756_07635 [Solirubrobacteraceae bacterium]|nr:hypothetical protein [Solirubrobacteraceae bacterium]